MWRDQVGFELGKMSLYGARRLEVGHHISPQGIEVNKVKVEVIEKLPATTSVKAVRSFFRHVGFYWYFIKDFSKITKPLFNLLLKDVLFYFTKQVFVGL